MPAAKMLAFTFNIKHSTFSANPGFSIIEILIAIFVFSLAFTATSFIITGNLRSASDIRNSFIASGLAQEGMETVRNIRDADWFLGNVFGTSIPDGIYRVEWNSGALITLGTNPPLKKDAVSGIFSYGSGTDTIFQRTVNISTVTAGVEKKIVVTVTWTARGTGTKILSAEEHLFNWK